MTFHCCNTFLDNKNRKIFPNLKTRREFILQKVQFEMEQAQDCIQLIQSKSFNLKFITQT